MRRALRLTELFFWSRQRLLAPRKVPAAALAATLGRLMTGPLPGPQDFEALAPVFGVARVRRIAGLDLMGILSLRRGRGDGAFGYVASPGARGILNVIAVGLDSVLSAEGGN